MERAEWFYPPEKKPFNVIELLTWTAGISLWIGLAYMLAQN